MPYSLHRSRLAVALIPSLLAACSPLQVLDHVVPFWGYEPTIGLTYGDDPAQVLDVYRPKGTSPAGGFPVVVFFYGGRWQGYFSHDQFRFIGDALTHRGVIAVVPEYRQFPAVKFPVFVEDGAGAVRFARDHATDWGGNPGRLFLAGHSAGAHIAALLATDEHYLTDAGLPAGALAGMAGLAGPYDFLPFKDDDIKVLMGPSKEWPLTQPITFIDGHEPPMFLAQGLDDDLVGLHNARNMATKMRAMGGIVETREYAGIDHYKLLAALAAPLRGLAPVLDDMLEFINAH